MAISESPTGVVYRILVTKVGLDGHDRGARVVARFFRDAGFEVIYGDRQTTVETIVATAIDEDVDVIGLSILSGAHRQLVPEVVRQLRLRSADIPVVVGGIISDEDASHLLEIGVSRVFGPGTPIAEMINDVRQVIGSL